MGIGKLIVINFGAGNLNIGFDSIILRIEDDNKSYQRERRELRTRLPQKPEIVRDYSKWLDKCFPVPSMSWNKVSEAFKNTLNDWLKSEPFCSDWNRLLSSCTHQDKIRVIFQTELRDLERIPWQFWDFFEIYPQTEMALSLPEYGFIKSVLNDKIRILAIIGDSTGINLEPDIVLIKQLPNVEEPKILCQRPRSEISAQIWQQNWDILFFAGHSRTEQGTGRIYINEHEFLSLEELQEGLRNAIERGLKLAIFNSCDGLGLGRSLAALNLPQAIVMRQPIADKLAQEFLKHFLTAFSHNGQTLYLAVKEAKNKLQEELGREFPCAKWLPVIYQNPAIIPPTWEELRSIPPEQKMLPTTESPSPIPQQSHDKLHQALQGLNYTDQVGLFRTFFEQYPISAYLIHGEENSGQQWLTTRLIKIIKENYKNVKKIVVDFSRKTRPTDIKGCWQELGGRVGLINDPSQTEIIDKVSQWCQTQTVILIFDKLNCIKEQLLDEYLDKLLVELWLPLMQGVRDRISQSEYRLLMFLIDHDGSAVEKCNIVFAMEVNPDWEPHIPIKLPKIDPIEPSDLINWAKSFGDNLPLKFTNQREETVQKIFTNGETLLPEKALIKICAECDCDWYDREEQWLKY